MAAFVEGTLPADQIAVVADHLRGCADCRIVVAETARFADEERVAPVAPMVRPSRWASWLAAAAVLATVAVSAPPLLRWVESRRAPIAPLIAAAPREHRTVEARLSGFPWARWQAPVRSTNTQVKDPADLQLEGAAGKVLERTRGKRDADSERAAGVANLLIDQRAESVSLLEQAARASNDPRTWNDLAAARFALADEHPSQLPEALADAEHALRLDPRNAEALFNRALIVESLGVRDRAREAWQRYLEVDPNSGWSVEARAHLRKLESSSRRFEPRMLDEEPPAQLVRDFPEETRRRSEATLLTRWAEAAAKGDEVGAAKTLARAHAVADALAASNGERLLGDAVTAIERSSGAARAQLAEAHRTYGAAGERYGKRDAAAAEPLFRRAADLFAQGGSPMSAVALSYAASAAFEQGRDVRDELTRLLASVDAGRHRALAAAIHWTLAIDANRAGDWGAGVRHADAAAAIFQALGERGNAAFTDGVAAYSLQVIGDADPAWTRLVRSFSAFCGRDAARCGGMLNDAGMTLAAIGRPDAAAALASLAVDDRHAPAVIEALALTKRARILAEDGADDTVAPLLAAARRAASQIRGREREQVETQISMQEAMRARHRDPRGAIAALDGAVAFCSARKSDPLLGYALLQRARARWAAGENDGAAADYAAALRTTAAQQSHIDDPSLRATFLDTASAAIEEGIELELARGATEAAFAIADRRHALDASARTQQPGPATAVIEYAVLPHSLAIFCVAGGRLSEQTVPIERSELAGRVNRFVDAIRGRAPVADVQRDGAELYRLLVAPLQPRLAGARELVVVPDRQLYAVPFAALYDEGTRHYVIEDYVVRIAPAAASPAGSGGDGALAPALVVADPHVPNAPPLRAGRDEAKRIASLLGGSALVSGDEATAQRFEALAPESALIHYTGHANSDVTSSYGALLLAGPDGAFDARRIAALPLRRRPLVVLAACGTFRGDPAHVAGMSSLARAFLLAGARGVVGTLWEVDDEVSAPLFLHFHEVLRTGVSPAHALQDAQLDLLRSPDARLSHPATWSPVELVQHI